MKKSNHLIKTLVLILTLIAITGLTNCKSTAEGDISPLDKAGLIFTVEEEEIESIEEGLSIIKNTLDPKHGKIIYKYKLKLEDREYFVYGDDIYEYDINTDTKNISSIISINEIPMPKEAKEINKNQAIEIAKNLVKKCYKDFFDYDVEVKAEHYPDPEMAWREFRVNFRQKNELGVYTGYDIDVELNKYGKISNFHALEGNPEVSKQKPKISKEKAIDIAYREAKKMVSEIIKREEKIETAVDEKAEAMGLTDEPMPPGDSGKYPEEPPKKPEKFRANLDERNKHKVTAELTVFKNILQWWIEIDNVEINREWGPMGFRVYIDAITGKVLFATHTE